MSALSTACIILVMAETAFSNLSDRTHSTCGLDQTILEFNPCRKKMDRHGDLVETVPVLVPVSSFMEERCGRKKTFGIRRAHRICIVNGPAPFTPPSPDKRHNTARQTLMSNDESTTKPFTHSTATPSIIWPVTMMPTVPGSTSAETTPATKLLETATPQTTLFETTKLTTSLENTPTKNVFKTYLQTDSMAATANSESTFSLPSSLEPKHQATHSLSIGLPSATPVSTRTETRSITTQTPSASVTTPKHNYISNATQRPIMSDTSQATNLSDTIPMPAASVTTQIPTKPVTTQSPTTSVTTQTQAKSAKIQTSTMNVSNKTPQTSVITTSTTSVTTQIPITSVTTQTPTTSVTTQTPTTSVTTQTDTSVTTQTLTSDTTQTDTTSVTTQTPTTYVSTQRPTTSVTTQTPTTRSLAAPMPSAMNCATVGDNCIVFVTDHQDKRIRWAYLHGPSSMQFSTFLFLEGKPSDVTFDPAEQKLYWSDIDGKRIWRTDLVNKMEEEVTFENTMDKPLGIIIAEQARYLYCTYESKGWINRVRLGHPDSEELFVDGLNKPKALAIDEQNGYLYWSRHEGIDRVQFDENGIIGSIEEIIYLPSFSKMYGLIINPEGTRLFFCDENSKEGLYLDIGVSGPVELIGSDKNYVLRDVNMGGDGVLYWLQSGYTRILEMEDYKSSTDFIIQAEYEFVNPQRMHIAPVDPWIGPGFGG